MPLNPNEITFDELAEENNDTNEASDLDEQESPTDQENENMTVEDEEEELENQEEDNLEFPDDSFDDSDQPEDGESNQEENTDEPENQEDEGEGGDEEDVEEEEEVRVVDQIANQFGFEEDDFDDELDDTFDDVIEVAKKGAEKMKNEELNNFFEQYPDIEQYTRYRVNGGDPDTFREEVLNAPSYDDLELDGNESTQERVVREKLQEVDGFSDEKIEDKIERYKSGGYLKDEAEDAREIMSSRQEKKQQELIEQQEKQAEQRRKEQLEEQKKYRETIHESNNLAGFQLPENQKEDFESYIFEPVDEETGETRAEQDYKNMSREEELTLYYLVYNGLDSLEDLVDNKASTKRADNLSDQLKKSSSRSVKDKSSKGTDRNDGNLDSLDLDSAIE